MIPPPIPHAWLRILKKKKPLERNPAHRPFWELFLGVAVSDVFPRGYFPVGCFENAWRFFPWDIIPQGVKIRPTCFQYGFPPGWFLLSWGVFPQCELLSIPPHFYGALWVIKLSNDTKHPHHHRCPGTCWHDEYFMVWVLSLPWRNYYIRDRLVKPGQWGRWGRWTGQSGRSIRPLNQADIVHAV